LTQDTLHEAEAGAATAAVWLTQETGVPDTLYASLSVLVRACWAQNSNDRPDFTEVSASLEELHEQLDQAPSTPARPATPAAAADG
jgi:hypothetical protein